jgi:uncharacterized protein YhfF
MCNIAEALRRAFTPPGTGALESQMMAGQQQANAASLAATNALTAAIDQTKTVTVPAADNPSARAAGLSAMQKIMAAQGNAWSFGGTPTSAPNVATKVLLGA